MTNEIKKINALIESLTILRDHIQEAVKNDPELEVTVDVSIKTNTYKLTYFFDGCKFYDVVNAEDEQHAFDYLCWISNDNDDYHLVKAEICNDLPSYWCPVGWVKPVDPEVAQYRSLMKSLEVAGIKQHDYYTPELDKIMRQSLGYTQRIVRDTGDDFGLWNFAPETYVEYTRQNHYTLRVKFPEGR